MAMSLSLRPQRVPSYPGGNFFDTGGFESLAHHRERHDVFAYFLDMAVCAIRKTTLPPRRRPVSTN